ncbi:MAG: hypothetical protein H7232_19430 [Aeromicrobium sp.]|nr:hypothetical protein [Burkholderiales bacterium]
MSSKTLAAWLKTAESKKLGLKSTEAAGLTWLCDERHERLSGELSLLRRWNAQTQKR